MSHSIAAIALALTATVSGFGCERSAKRDPGTTETRENEMKSAKGFVGNIESLTTENKDFRRVLYTAKSSQLVVMAVPPGDHIGLEVHDVDQFLRVEAGTGEVLLDDTRTTIGPETAIVVPAGTKHDVLNTGTVPLKLYTVYSPPHHRDGVVHRTRMDAEKDEEHFDGKTTQ